MEQPALRPSVPAPRYQTPRATPVTTLPIAVATIATNSGPTSGEPITLDNIKGRPMTQPGVRDFCFKNNLCFYCKEPNHNSMNCPNKNRRAREHHLAIASTYEDESTTGGALIPGNA